MGSSASFSVCLATALLISCGRITPRLLPEDKELINKWAFQAEKIFHGKPSGIDNSICTYGGALLFENGLVADILPEMQNINVLLVNTRVSRNTKALVAAVRQKKEVFPSIIDPVFESINAISKQCWNLLKNTISPVSEEEMAVLENLINMNHHLLNSLGAGHPKLNQIHNIAESYHCASKLTGAGGGGSAIILLPIKNTEEKSSIIDSLKKELQ
ncbi:Mevalonate kinase, partial [Stegodyphus mimosarum]